MRKSSLGMVGTIAAGFVIALGGVSPANAGQQTIIVPDDFTHSDTRATGHYEVEGTALHIWTEGETSTDKVAEYVNTKTALADAAEPSLDYTSTAGGVPGFQLVVDFDADGTADGILVGEPGAYGNKWWLTNGSKPFVKDGAPSTGGGVGSGYYGTLDEWRSASDGAVVTAFGFSLGSGVKGDGVLNAINFAGDRYTFQESVTLAGKNECKKDGWKNSNSPVFKNQGQCVSSFAHAK